MRAKKIDNTQREIVDALRSIFCSVFIINDTFDLVVGCRGKTFLADCKTPRGKKKRRITMQKSQTDLIDSWRGGPVLILTSAEQAVAEILKHT